jgi:hypothetical protein
MANQSKNPSTILWNKRAAKRYVDEEFFHSISSWELPKSKFCNVLSLPASQWYWEREFTATFPNAPVKFTGVERNAKVLKAMKKSAESLSTLNKKHKFVPVDKPTDVQEFLNNTEESFDIIYLDWMGTWSHDKYKQIKTIINRDLLKKHGFLRLTMSLNRGHPKVWRTLCSQYDESLIGVRDMRGGGSELPAWKVYGVPGLIMKEAFENGVRLKLVSNMVYISRETPTSRGTSELSVSFRRY